MLKPQLFSSYFLTLVLIFILLPTTIQATVIYSLPDPTAFRSYKDVANINIPVTSVVELPLDDLVVARYQFAVQDLTDDNRFIPYYFNNKLDAIPLTAETEPSTTSPNNLVDQNSLSYTEFTLTNQQPSQTKISLSSSTPIQSSALTLNLFDNVALPTHIAITANTSQGQEIIVARKKLKSTIVRFPATTADQWNITFTYSQPLRLNELTLQQDTATKTRSRSIRWLAEPGREYRVYLDPDKSVPATRGESGNLTQNKDIVSLASIPATPNDQYIIADSDQDGIPNITDNCVKVPNQDQTDLNQNDRGDVCDDFDRDGIRNFDDNCPDQPNKNQADVDADNIGDACDTEENRLTEKYSWVPWVGIGSATVILIILFIFTAYSMKKRPPDQPNETPDEPPKPPANNPPDPPQTTPPANSV